MIKIDTMAGTKTKMRRDGGPVQLGDILRQLIEKNTGRKVPLRNVRLFEVWDRTVGQQVARVARPQSIQNDRLFVGVAHPTWVTELSFRREELRVKLNAAVGYEAIREIVFRLARGK